jgi:hypothetical protein
LSVVVNRPLKSGDLCPPHLAEGREPYPYVAMNFQNPDRIVWADDFASLVSVFSGAGAAYLHESDQFARHETRSRWLNGCQIQLQAFINTRAQFNGDWAGLTEWERQVLNGRRTLDDQPHGFPTGDLFGVDLWSAEVPLVCLVGAGPEHPIVTSNDALIVLDALSDETAVQSLAWAGYLRLWTATVDGGEA